MLEFSKILLRLSKFLILGFLLLSMGISCAPEGKPADNKNKNIIVLTPEIAEIVCALDASNMIVAVTRECDFPRILKTKTQVGSFSTPDIEKIISLQPDLVFVSGLEQEIVKNKLSKLSTKVYQFYPNTVDSLLRTINKIGKLIDKEKAADSLVKHLQHKLNQINIPKNKPTVYFEVYKNPLMTATGESYVGDVIRKSGGINTFASLARDYCRVPAERVIKANPDIIIISYPGITPDDVKNRLGWSSINAVQNGQIFTQSDINMETVIRASPRAITGIKQLNKIFNNAAYEE